MPTPCYLNGAKAIATAYDAHPRPFAQCAGEGKTLAIILHGSTIIMVCYTI